jgi:predicted Zn-dependent protease with MMP-like domain
MEKRDSTVACSEDEFAALAESELDALPGWIKSAIATHNVAISIEDQHPDEPRTLGMFAEYSGASEITLYRLPINRVAVDRHHLRRAIHDTLLHELGHLFGMTETDLDHYSIGNTPLPDAEPVHAPRGDARAENEFRTPGSSSRGR